MLAGNKWFTGQKLASLLNIKSNQNNKNKIKLYQNEQLVTDLFQTLFLHLVPDRQDRPRLDSANVGVAVGLL